MGTTVGEVRDRSIPAEGMIAAVGRETIEITTVGSKRSQVLELFRAISRPLDSTTIPWPLVSCGARHAKAP
jgi:hypothetical protein